MCRSVKLLMKNLSNFTPLNSTVPWDKQSVFLGETKRQVWISIYAYRRKFNFVTSVLTATARRALCYNRPIQSPQGPSNS